MTLRYRTPRWPLFSAAALAGLATSVADSAVAQDSSLFHRGDSAYNMPLTVETADLLYAQPQPPKTLQLHDLVTVVVNLNSRVLSEGDVQSRKVSRVDAKLQDWILLDRLSKVIPDPQSAGDPRVQAQLNSQYRAQADLETRNTLTFSIAAQIVDVLPNGTLRIEAREIANVNGDLWERSLTGIIRREDVTPDNKILTEDVAELQVQTRETGQIRDSYRRGWLHKLYDRFMPF